MSVVGVLGGSGFVGAHVVRALERDGVEARIVKSPRLSTSGRDLAAVTADLDRPERAGVVQELRERLLGCSAVVNAAGLATATAHGDDLFGANSLLPGVVARALCSDVRLVHVSSAAVQGRRAPLDESEVYEPFSPYSASKVVGEQIMLSSHRNAVCYRPTSVHGPGRAVTERLARLLGSPAASVAGTGDDPTPQVLVENVGDVAKFLALVPSPVPRIVLHPSEGLTTSELVRRLGGREPRHVPVSVARAVIVSARTVGSRSARAAGEARRLEMLWFGQAQEPGWLEGRWSAPQSLEAWKELR
ncbi:NAD-dependent epimerase/dehydratase family protein [Nocardioides sambongensis]|uniref:NAD-dependent epimerase/dehydratase family protein n=1 Tax=Nocardioides sambongensis TaxID=2589074 RepID=UPI0011262208|nr:NAD(P)-dependent oxidoreductase [Nocardioides sambongensis]